MIKGVKTGKEIVVNVANKVGILADLSRLVSGLGVNIEAVSGYAVDKEAKIILVTSDNASVTNTLKASGYSSLEEKEVIIIELKNKAGALKEITEKLAGQGVDIKRIYGTTCSVGCPAKLVLSTSDNTKALSLLK